MDALPHSETSEGQSSVMLIQHIFVSGDKEMVENAEEYSNMDRNFPNKHKCSICFKTFAKATYLKLHMRTHTGERPYICDTCEKSFYDQAGLQRHSLIHKGVKPFSCDHCGKGFRQKCDLKKHAVQHLNKAEIEQAPDLYKCKQCGAGFKYKGYLKNHIAESHVKNFKCEYCDRKLSSTSALRLHTRLHTGDRPFKCPHCPKSYTSGYQMRTHVMSHTGIKPIKCDLCEKAFISPSRMKTHRVTHERSSTGVPRRRKHKESKPLEKQFNCVKCGQRFALEFSMKLHNKMLHGDVKALPEKDCNKTLPPQNNGTLADSKQVINSEKSENNPTATGGEQ